MTYLISKYDLLNEFRILSIDQFEIHLNSIPPSLCEYHLENIILYSDICNNINHNQISKELHFGSFVFYFDYQENIYIQKNNNFSNCDDSMPSLW